MENEKDLPPGTPSPKAQSWGALISIVIIVLMIIIGAFYAWGKRVSQNNVPAAATAE
jgi:NADH:ubiquinone oxidoreductase subunit 3 (subunit A)